MIEQLLEALDAAREDFLDALAAVDADLVTVPGVVEDWSVRDVVVHVAAWADHASAALDLATGGRGDAFDYDDTQTDAMNERILAEGRAVAPAAALAREEESFAAFRDRVARLDPGLLELRLGNGDIVEEVIRYDGPDHYAEHTAHLRSWFAADDDDDVE
ncbi:MAG TPA: maleylpyruvate isomerase N-terminal domain-containing protein [Candidatus Angelobacter sp.]|nr:maleylpyruvate isomerase N-terminal domain-containing protein [Candidatus Angelobacter sp.]